MPHRRQSLRLPEFSYTGGHGYFITMCTAKRRPLLSSIVAGQTILSAIGVLVDEDWRTLALRRSGLITDLHIIMPDHLHGILILGEGCDATLPAVMASFKGGIVREARRARVWDEGPLWQRGYHEWVIRGPRHLRRLREYILANPYRWRG